MIGKQWLKVGPKLGLPLLAVAVAALAMTWGHGTTHTARAGYFPRIDMSISITGCDEGTVTANGGDAKCTLALGSIFTVSYELNSYPGLPDEDFDGVHGYEEVHMVSVYSGVQYKTATFVALHGSGVLMREPPELLNRLSGAILFFEPCIPPDVPLFGICESVAQDVTVWTADFNCAARGSVDLSSPGTHLAAGEVIAFLSADLSIAINCVERPVGGIAVDPERGALPLDTADSSGRGTGVLVGIAAGAVAFVAVGGAAVYARRRVRS